MKPRAKVLPVAAPAVQCAVCHRNPDRANNGWSSECSHVDCPHRRRAWSERPSGLEHKDMSTGRKKDEAPPLPLDAVIGKPGVVE